MKKLLSLLLCAGLLTVALASCAAVKPVGEAEPKESEATTTADPHAGHDHGTTTDNGAGHSTTTAAPSTGRIKYQIYTNADQTFRLVIRDHKNAILFEADKLIRAPLRETIDEANGIYELGWATGSGATEYECVYYNDRLGLVSQQFHAPLGTDGTRIAYCSADQTKVIVQDLFDSKGYYKEHLLEGAYNRNGTIITGGKLQADKNTVLIAYYINEKGETRHMGIKLHA